MAHPNISPGTIAFINRINNIKTKEDLNSEAQHFQEQVITSCKIKQSFAELGHSNKTGPNTQKTSLVNKNDKHQIQGLYRYQQHRAVQEILFGPTKYCTISDEKIEKRYQSLLGIEQKCNITELPSCVWQNIAPDEKYNLSLSKNFTPNEVKKKLSAKIYSKLSNSRSVGLDKVKYNDLRKYDPDCQIIAALFNACLRLKTVPDIWKKTSYAVLIKDKDGDENEIANWRTVTMHSTISKLFQSVITSRLIMWTKNTSRLSTTQKSLLMYNAACESSFILQECKTYSQKKNKDFVVAWLDFSNAVESIPQKAILYALQQHLLPDLYLNMIKSCIQGVETKIRTFKGFTNSISILKGLPQGAPLNPILIDLIVEPILKSLAVEDKFQIFNHKINHFAIPYELTLIADTVEKLQNLLNNVEKTAKNIGLKFNINSCSTFHCDSKDNIQKTRFSFFQQKLTVLPSNKINEYFGVKQGLSIGQDGVPTINEMIDSINAIDTSLLDSYQKLESIQTYVMPRVENCLRGLQEYDKNAFEQVHKFLNDKIKSWLDLPSDMTEETIVLQVSLLNQNIKEVYLPFSDLFFIMKIVHAYKMFSSQDEIVKSIAFDSLTAEISELTKKKPITKENLASYLSGNLQIKNVKLNSMWQLVRQGTLNLKTKINLKWRYNNEMQLVIKNNRNKALVLQDLYQCDVEEHLKKYLVQFYIKDVKKKIPDATKNAQAVASAIKNSKTRYKKTKKSQNDGKNSQIVTAKVPPLLSSNFPVLL